MQRSTNLVIISGPSGAGKDAVIEELIRRGLPIERVITSVTRPKRPGEVEGKSHYFVSSEEIQLKIKNGEMAEWAEVYGNLYGVTNEELERVKSQKDKIGIWRIEEQGARTARKKYPDILTLAIVAPQAEIEKRRNRRADVSEEATQRVERKEWTGEEGLYDYKVENREGELQKAVDHAVEILKKEHYIQ